MKFGLLSSILDGWSFEEVIDFAAENGFACVELACWPRGKAERRYGGVSHFDVDAVAADDAKIRYVQDYCKQKNVEISSLAYYPNTLDPDLEKRAAAIAHIMKLIDLSAALGVNMVTTFIGRDQSKTVEENLKIVSEVWPLIMRHAEEKHVRVAIENCPMLFGADQWPGGQNLMTSPVLWKKVFDVVGSDALGINFDPSHCVWQMLDYIGPVYEFKDKIFHVHFKDIKLYPEKLKACGTMAYPLDYMSPKIPSLGDVNWGKFVSALTDIGYEGAAVLEIEDKAFESSKERIIDSIHLARDYMRQFVI